jgi:hypothetical protein
MASWQLRRFTAPDDRGASYQIRFRGGHAAGELLLRPDLPHQTRWLDLITAPGEPATRIDLAPQVPAPAVTVTRNAHSPGELLLDVIAARILTSAAPFPQDNPEQLAAAKAELRAFATDGPVTSSLRCRRPTRCPRPARRAVRQARYQRPRHHRAARRRSARTVAQPADPLPPPQAAGGARARHPGRDRGRAARAGRRHDRDPRPAPRRARQHPAHAGQRRHAGGRLGVTGESGPCRCCGSTTAPAAGAPRAPAVRDRRGTAARSCCGLRPCPG